VTEAGYDDTLRNRRTFDTIAAALERRRRRGVAGVAIMSCDNLPGNGDAARRCVLAAASRAVDSTGTADAALVGWIHAHCSFPNSMVDRITPVTTDADRDHLLAEHGLVDRWPVVGEPFLQWVLDDDFAAGRPEFSDVGALYTDDVHAWELYKLRLLNAGHSAIAYLSALAGIEFVDEAMATPSIRAFLERLLHDEAVPSLAQIPGHPAADYADVVVERFANTGVRDQIARLCIDGTSKFPTFLMPTIATQLRSGGPVADAALALAGWAHYLATVPESEQAPDALAERSRPLAQAAMKDPATFVDPATGFPDAVAVSERFVAEFSLAHRTIAERGALGALESSRRS
ncbi:MAG: mannitol dehydrogenase family protein, partial [Actinomycetota bacterium]